MLLTRPIGKRYSDGTWWIRWGNWSLSWEPKHAPRGYQSLAAREFGGRDWWLGGLNLRYHGTGP